MSVSAKIAGTWRGLAPFVRKNGLWSVAEVSVKDSGSWSATNPTPLSASADPVGLSQGYLSGQTAIVTDAVTVTASGGTAPYAYAWVKDSAGSWTINSPASATTTFGVSTVYPNEYDLYAHCIVTDADGATARVDVSLNIWPESGT